MASRFLCTTALEQTWHDYEPILFLGEWCRRFTRKERWSKLDAAVLPYHWDDRAKLHGDYRYLQGFYERLLPELAAELNRRHGVDRSVRYWRILIGPWLGYFVQILFDRWESINQSIRDHELSGTVVLLDSKQNLVAKGMAEFVQIMVDDDWNHNIYGAILQHSTNVPTSFCAAHTTEGTCGPEPIVPWARQIKQALRARGSRLARFFASDKDALFHSTGLSFGQEMRLGRRLGQAPQLWSLTPAIQAAVDCSARNWTLPGESRSPFEALAHNMIPAQMPTVYLEGYRQLCEQSALLPWPRRPKLIWTTYSQYSDDVFKAWTADKVERGVPLVIGQHGGHLGVGRWSFIEEHDVAISDRYLSWGWSDVDQPKVTPVCQLKTNRPPVRRVARDRALMVAVACPRFSYWIYSGIVARQWLDYFDDQCRFVERLPDRVRGVLTVRLYSQDFGWDQIARWRDRFPVLRLDEGMSKMADVIRDCRLYISTYNATTYLETFAMDVPTVIYWNPDVWELRDAANPYFDDLRRVGIFHGTPESAADHIAHIWDNVNEWWTSKPVREVLHRFKHRYCRATTDVAACIEPALRAAFAPGDDKLAC